MTAGQTHCKLPLQCGHCIVFRAFQKVPDPAQMQHSRGFAGEPGRVFDVGSGVTGASPGLELYRPPVKLATQRQHVSELTAPMSQRTYRQSRVRIIRTRCTRFSDDRHWKRVIATVEDGLSTGNACAVLVPYHLSPDGDHFDAEFAGVLAGSILAEAAELEREKIRRQGPGSGLFRPRVGGTGLYTVAHRKQHRM